MAETLRKVYEAMQSSPGHPVHGPRLARLPQRDALVPVRGGVRLHRHPHLDLCVPAGHPGGAPATHQLDPHGADQHRHHDHPVLHRLHRAAGRVVAVVRLLRQGVQHRGGSVRHLQLHRVRRGGVLPVLGVEGLAGDGEPVRTARHGPQGPSGPHPLSLRTFKGLTPRHQLIPRLFLLSLL